MHIYTLVAFFRPGIEWKMWIWVFFLLTGTILLRVLYSVYIPLHAVQSLYIPLKAVQNLHIPLKAVQNLYVSLHFVRKILL